MIEYKTGDMFDEQVEALVNSVNCVGAMGRGIALQFKKRFPDNYKAYAEACKRGEVKPGRMFVYELGHMTYPRYIVNFPTKRHWRGKSRLEDIEAGLGALAVEVQTRKIRSIAIPPLGTNLGGLRWEDVRPRIEEALGGLSDLRVTLFEPGGGPVDNRPNRSTKAPEMTRGKAALIGLMDRYLRGVLDPSVTLLEVQKLMYFMQVAGEPLRLHFEEGHYGPYADTLRHVLVPLEDHLISGYKDGGNTPGMQLGLVPGAVEDATAFLEGQPETRERLERVAQLVEGFESSFGLELLATVHWIADHRSESDEVQIIEYAYAWNPRKRQFSGRQIKLALDVLREKGWLDPASADDHSMSDREPDAGAGPHQHAQMVLFE